MSEDEKDVKIVRKQFGNETIGVIHRKLRPRPAMGSQAAPALEKGELPTYMLNGFGDYPPVNTRTYEVCPGIICDQDTAIPLRDGTITYCDIYRPAGQTNIPVIIAWSLYGKRPGADLQIEWQTVGVPAGSCSPHAKFEGPDPEYWCHKGYAIANYDAPGVGNSEGDIYLTPSQEGLDTYDVIEFLAGLEWCNGKVGMAGNSCLAVCQWKAASEHPPHLVCIAPWEGNIDTYRELLNMGGITECGFNPFLTSALYGPNYIEDHYLMVLEYPLCNGYWEDKVPKLEQIEVPAYITGGWNHFHLRGALMAYRNISSKQKWLRIHRDFEWPDQYSRDSIDDLNRFFDRYLKGIRNGWESTPRVRIDVMDAYDCDYQTKRHENEFPLARTEYKKLYLDAESRSLCGQPAERESSAHYDGNLGKATFDIIFDEQTEITGYMKLRLWVEADGNDDMDLFIAVQKLDNSGKWLPTNVMGKPHPGAPGRLRVSLRETDVGKSTEFQPIYPYNNPQKLKPGEIVPVDIEIWPSSRIWHAGEQLRVEVMGHYERIDWFEPFKYDTNNKGNHIIHTGGKYDSHLLVPVIPPKYVAGNVVYR